MSQDHHPRDRAVVIPDEAFAALVDFCIGSLGLEDAPEEEDLGYVVAYLLGLGMQAIEDEAVSGSRILRMAA